MTPEVGTQRHAGVWYPRFTRRYITRIVTIPVGILFLIAGISKLFVIDPFAETVASVSLLSREAARGAAFAIIALEILGALILLSGRWTRFIALMFAFLVAGFITVLTLAVLQRREIACNCFGILGIRLSNLHELILDLVLFNVFLALTLFARQGSVQNKSSPGGTVGGRWKLYIAGGLMLESLLMYPVVSRALGPWEGDYRSVVTFAENADSLFAQHGGANRMLLLLDYSDFSCPICFDDFSALADSLRGRFDDSQRHNIVALFRERPQSSFDSPDRLRHWIAANDIRFPVLLTPAGAFQTIHFVKSMAVVVDPEDRILFSEIFPMGISKRALALRLLETTYTN